MITGMTKTKFEKDLEEYFPDIYKLHQIGKEDPFVWEIIDAMLEMYEAKAYGRLLFTYQDGRINHVFKTLQTTASKSMKGKAIRKRQMQAELTIESSE